MSTLLMMTPKVLRLLLAGFLITFISPFSWACDPLPGQFPATLAERVASTPYVFTATVTQVEGHQVTVAVKRYFKGQGPDTLTIDGFNTGIACHDFLQINDHVIFFAEGDVHTVLSAVYDHVFGSVRPATPENSAAIEAALAAQQCFIYVLQDEGLNDAQLFILDPQRDFELTLLGPQHTAHDLEGLAIHPQTQEIYVSSGDDAAPPHQAGFIYQVNSSTGHLIACGSTGFGEVSAISFQPDGRLWGWAEYQGLIQIDLDNQCRAQLVFPHVEPPFEVEAMTWDSQGQKLYGIAEGSETLFVYQAHNNDLNPICDHLPVDVEALGILTDDTLLMGFDHSDQLALFNLQTCRFEANTIDTNYRDIEGVAVLCRSPEDVGLRARIQALNLSGDPRHGRAFPDIRSPLAQLGKRLFFSKALGGDRDSACVSCHHPLLGGGDNLALSIGVGAHNPDQLGPGRTHAPTAVGFDGGPTVPRNASTTFNIGLWDQAMFWDGRVESLGKTPDHHGNDGYGIRTPESVLGTADPYAGAHLTEAQARFPVTSAEEMRGFEFAHGQSNQQLRQALTQRLVEQIIPNQWLALFQQAFNSQADAATLINYANIATAISIYERSQLFVNNPWKRYVAGNDSALTPAAKRGAGLFFNPITAGGAGCFQCHQGDFFTDEHYHVLAIPQIGRGKGDGVTQDDDFGRFRETGDPFDQYAFRTPTLLNVAVTAPYGHDGAYAYLEAIVRHHLNVAEAVEQYPFDAIEADPSIQHEHAETNTRAALAQLQALRAAGRFTIEDVRLDQQQVNDIIEFLHALTDPCVYEPACLAPWIADPATLGPDGLQLNAVDSQSF